MNVIAIIGASGFIGGHLLYALRNRNDIEIRALIPENEKGWQPKQQNVKVHYGDLLNPDTLYGFLDNDCIVINLAYLANQTKETNIKAIFNLIKICADTRIRRLVHLSTAVVAGRAQHNMIDENTICKPISMYERIKLEIENHLLAASKNIFEVVILRPTAVFGANGKNLVKLADALLTSRRSVNYLKSCLFNYRTMNLVYIDNVISAIMFLIGEDHEAVNGQVFIISDDEDPSNNYRDIEISLMDYFKQKKYIFPVIPVPLYILSLFLRCIGRTSYNPSVVYSCRKILDTGFKKPVLFKDALREFAEWYINDFSPNKSQHN